MDLRFMADRALQHTERISSWDILAAHFADSLDNQHSPTFRATVTWRIVPLIVGTMYCMIATNSYCTWNLQMRVLIPRTAQM